LVLSESAIFAYKVDNNYAPKYDAGIHWNDPTVNIQWGLSKREVLVSDKDGQLPFLTEFDSPFTI
jgi:dTDP-4-dehydrorhamnose 3,5-epimerase